MRLKYGFPDPLLSTRLARTHVCEPASERASKQNSRIDWSGRHIANAFASVITHHSPLILHPPHTLPLTANKSQLVWS